MIGTFDIVVPLLVTYYHYKQFLIQTAVVMFNGYH